MARRIFNPEEKDTLLQNENVAKISESTITYTPEFKVMAVLENVRGKTPLSIFLEAGIDIDIIGHRSPKERLKRWRRIWKQRGEEGLILDIRGKSSTGRPLKRELTLEEKLLRAEARVKYLESENELLKKLDEIDRSVVVNKAANKFALIHQLVSTEDGKSNVDYLCEVAGVSRSGYYRWVTPI